MTLDGYAAIESNPVLGNILDATLTSLDCWQEPGQMLSVTLSDFARDRRSLEWLARAVAMLGRHPKLANGILFALEEVADSQELEGHLTRSLAPLGREPKLIDALSVALAELGSGPWSVQELAEAAAAPLAGILAEELSTVFAFQLSSTLERVGGIPTLAEPVNDSEDAPTLAVMLADLLAGALGRIFAHEIAEALGLALARTLANSLEIRRTFAVDYAAAFSISLKGSLTDALIPLLVGGLARALGDPDDPDDDYDHILANSFGRRLEHPIATDAELNAIFVPLRDLIVRFKQRTNVSWLVILPAAQKISMRLLVTARGIDSTRRHYAAMLKDIDNTQNIPSGALVGVRTPPVAPDQLAEVNALLWGFANNRLERGVPIEHVAQAFGAFALMVSEKVVDKVYSTILLKQAYQELLVDDLT